MMKRIFLFVGIFIILLIVAFFVLSSYSAKVLKPKLQESLGPGISFTQLKIGFGYVSGFGILIEQPQTKQKLLEVNEIRIYPSILSLFSKEIVLNNIVLSSPSIFVYRTKDNAIIGPGIQKQEPQQAEKKGKKIVSITIGNINVRQGSLLFTDNLGLSPPAIIHLIQLESNIRNIKFPPVESKCLISLKGKLSDEDKGDVDIHGWLNLKSTDTHLDASVTSADITKFRPYYKNEIGDIIQRGFATITSILDQENNIANISGKVHLSDLKIDTTSQIPLKVSTKDLSDFIKKHDNQIDVNFHAKGNLKDPDFNMGKEIASSATTDLLKSMGASLGEKGKDTLKSKLEEGKEKTKSKIKEKTKKLF